MRKGLLLAMLTMILAGCDIDLAFWPKRNIDYFVISNIDTRKDAETNVALLKNVKKNSWCCWESSSDASIFSGDHPNTGAKVNLFTVGERVVRVEYELGMFVPPDGAEMKAIEMKYGFDKISGRENNTVRGNSIIKYNCEITISVFGDKTCSIIINSFPYERYLFITWNDLLFRDSEKEKQIENNIKKLP